MAASDDLNDDVFRRSIESIKDFKIGLNGFISGGVVPSYNEMPRQVSFLCDLLTDALSAMEAIQKSRIGALTAEVDELKRQVTALKQNERHQSEHR